MKTKLQSFTKKRVTMNELFYSGTFTSNVLNDFIHEVVTAHYDHFDQLTKVTQKNKLIWDCENGFY